MHKLENVILSILLEQYSLRFTITNLLVRQVGSSTLYAPVCPSDVTTISALDSNRQTRARSMGCSARQMGCPLIIFEFFFSCGAAAQRGPWPPHP